MIEELRGQIADKNRQLAALDAARGPAVHRMSPGTAANDAGRPPCTLSSGDLDDLVIASSTSTPLSTPQSSPHVTPRFTPRMMGQTSLHRRGTSADNEFRIASQVTPLKLPDVDSTSTSSNSGRMRSTSVPVSGRLAAGGLSWRRGNAGVAMVPPATVQSPGEKLAVGVSDKMRSAWSMRPPHQARPLSEPVQPISPEQPLPLNDVPSEPRSYSSQPLQRPDQPPGQQAQTFDAPAISPGRQTQSFDGPYRSLDKSSTAQDAPSPSPRRSSNAASAPADSTASPGSSELGPSPCESPVMGMMHGAPDGAMNEPQAARLPVPQLKKLQEVAAAYSARGGSRSTTPSQDGSGEASARSRAGRSKPVKSARRIPAKQPRPWV